MMKFLKKIKNKLRLELPPPTKSVMREADRISSKLQELLWAQVFNNTLQGCSWVKDRSFSPGRWALGYPAMYALLRILNSVKPECILELGLGQSTRLTAQYTASNPSSEHFVVEHNPDWISFFCEEFHITGQTRIVQLDLDYVQYMDAPNIRRYQNFKDTFCGKKFDLIVIDAPVGSDMKQFARIDVLELLPDCLAERFIIMIDDTNRSGEQNTVNELCSILERSKIPYAKGDYVGQKRTTVICSDRLAFLTTL